MGSYRAASFSITTSQKSSNCDEIFMQHRLHFADGLKDLKNLSNQLYSAAEYFESSYDKDDHKHFMIESSREYVTKALVSTVDHLGSVADKLNKFLDEKANEFSSTKIRFSSIEQRLNMFREFKDVKGVSQHTLVLEASKHHKQYLDPGVETFQFGRPKVVYRNCISCTRCDTVQSKQGNPFVKAFQAAIIRPPPPLLSKGHPRIFSSESSPNPVNFSFTRVLSNKEAGKRSVSKLRFALARSGSAANGSVSRSPSDNKQLCPSEHRRASISVCMKPEMTNREKEIETPKRNKNIFKALLSVHGSRKEIAKSNTR